MNILNNLKHVNIIDKLVRLQASKGKAYSLPLLRQSIERLFPEYKQDQSLESKLSIILSYQ